MSAPRIVLADDHRLFAEGLAALLSPDNDIVAIVEDGEALLEAVAEHTPDIVVTDLSMPKLNGIECVRKLQESAPDVKVVLLTMHEDVALATSAMRAGASGYLLKNGGAREVLRAIEEIMDGGVHISTRIAKDVMHMLSQPEAKSELTPRQEQIVQLLVEGLSAKEIAARLHLSPRTIEFHKYQAMDRVGVATTAELIALAVKRGLGPV